MDRLKTAYSLYLVILYGGINFNCHSQVINNKAEREKLILVSKIILPKVTGRIDHISYDSINHLAFIAALGNNTVEVADISTSKVVHTFTNLDEPQGVLYISPLNKLVVANGGNGNCVFFDTRTYGELGRVNLRNDADNIRYSPTTGLLYVGYGNGGIAILDADKMKQVGVISLDGHPESFQVSEKQDRIYINVPAANEIEVGQNSTNKIIAKWGNTNASSNFPMALDEENNRLFIGCRSPATLRMVSTKTGKDLAAVSCSGDADDVFYNPADSLVFVSTGEGFIDVFRATQNDLVGINHIKTSSGARTSLLLASEKRFLLAVPAHLGKPASLWVYNIDN